MKKALSIFVLISVLTLCGCYEPKDINSLGFLLALGIDDGKYTMQFANPIAFAGSDGEFSEDSLKTYTVDADSLNSAINIAQENLLKKVDTSYLELVVFSNKFKNGEIKNYIDIMQKNSRFHPDTFVAISKCSPEEFLNDVSDNLEMNPSKYYDNIFSNKYNLCAPAATIKSCAGDISVIPVVDKGNNCTGAAVLNSGEIKYYLTKYNGEIYNVLTGNSEVFTIDADHGLTIKFYLPSRVIPKIKDNQVLYNFKIKGEVIENIYNVSKEKISDSAEKKLKNDFEKFIQLNYYLKNQDVLKIKDLYKKHYLTNTSYNNFTKSFNANNLKFKFNINIDITRDGVMLNEN